MRRFLIVACIMMLVPGIDNILHAQNKEFLVCLDAGHGGHDAGAVGRPTSNREKDINLAITLKVGQLLRQNCPDVKVLYTRDRDVFVKLDERANIANKAKADLFVSIHTNAIERGAGRQPMGVQSYTLTLRTAGTNLEVEKRENSVIQFEADGEQKYSFMNPNSAESEIMFELMQDRDMQESVNFAKLAQEEMVKSGGRRDLGVLQANLAVLRLTYMPSVLLEVGFISTPAEERFLMSDEGRTVMAQCIYNAISRYKTQHTGRMSKLEKISAKVIEDEAALEQEEGQEDAQQSQGAAQGKEAVQVRDAAQNKAAGQAKDAPVAADAKPVNADAKPVPVRQETMPVAAEAEPVFKIQILTSKKNLIPGSTHFKGLATESFKENDIYKYTCGSTTDYKEILKLKREIAPKFPDSFIIAFKNGVKVNTNEAINEWKKKH